MTPPLSPNIPVGGLFPLEELFPSVSDQAPVESPEFAETKDTSSEEIIHQPKKPAISIGPKLRLLRIMNKMTQLMLGERSGINRRMISSIEMGSSRANSTTADKLAAALGVPVEELCEQDSSTSATSPFLVSTKNYKSDKIEELLKEVLTNKLAKRAELARSAHLSTKTINNIEKHKYQVKRKTAAKLGPVLEACLATRKNQFAFFVTKK